MTQATTQGGQSRRASMTEAAVNMAIGYFIAILAQAAIFPLFGVHLPMSQHAAMGGLFTVVSLVRSYLLRRAFNWWHCRAK